MRALAWTMLLCVACVGCGGSSDSGVISPELQTLSGTWNYQIVNAYEARFVECTGDAAILEGMSFYPGLSAAPLCAVPNSLEVIQNGDTLEVLPQDVDCGGVPASVAGQGAISADWISGAWEIASNEGLAAVHQFSGTMSGSHLELLESARSFEGMFAGACNLAPPLKATVTIR